MGKGVACASGVPGDPYGFAAARPNDGDPYGTRTRVFAVRAEPIWLNRMSLDVLKHLIFLDFIGKVP